MRGRPWGVALLVVGGVAIGVAVAGMPSRGEDPPFRIDASETSTTAVTTTTTSTTTTTVAPTSTTRPRR